MRLAFDEQIFAIQEYGGISRLFAELSKQFVGHPEFGVELEPLRASIVNRYVLDTPQVREYLKVTEAGGTYQALARYFSRRRPRVDVDIIHNTFYLPHGLTGYPGAKRVVTIHDMIPERMPKTRRRLDFITRKHRYVELADHVICVSESTQEDMLQVYGQLKAPISVVHHGVDPVFQPGAKRRVDLPQKYLLFVGNRGQYKDADVLLRAFPEVTKQFPEYILLFIGGGPFTRSEDSLIAELGLVGKVQQRTLPDSEMSAAYEYADICVFPSRFEGFGLPALESMASGTATILARATSLPEVGGDAAAYFTPGHDLELATVIKRLLADTELLKRYSSAGILRAQQFSWSKSAVQTAAVYQSVLQ